MPVYLESGEDGNIKATFIQLCSGDAIQYGVDNASLDNKIK